MGIVIGIIIGGLALTLTFFQEVRRWMERRHATHIDVRSMWRARAPNDFVELVVVEILAFNPADRGTAISHARLELRDEPDVRFELARPKKIGTEWELEPLDSRHRIRVSGDFDFPYTMPPITLGARQAESAVLAFMPATPLQTVDVPSLRFFARISAPPLKPEGWLGWRRVLGRERAPFTEVEARWLDAGVIFAGTSVG